MPIIKQEAFEKQAPASPAKKGRPAEERRKKKVCFLMGRAMVQEPSDATDENAQTLVVARLLYLKENKTEATSLDDIKFPAKKDEWGPTLDNIRNEGTYESKYKASDSFGHNLGQKKFAILTQAYRESDDLDLVDFAKCYCLVRLFPTIKVASEQGLVRDQNSD